MGMSRILGSASPNHEAIGSILSHAVPTRNIDNEVATSCGRKNLSGVLPLAERANLGAHAPKDLRVVLIEVLRELRRPRKNLS
jgi:hypothetical protein